MWLLFLERGHVAVAISRKLSLFDWKERMESGGVCLVQLPEPAQCMVTIHCL